MHRIRWWLFKRLSKIGWRICPEPERSDLQAQWGVKLVTVNVMAEVLEQTK